MLRGLLRFASRNQFKKSDRDIRTGSRVRLPSEEDQKREMAMLPVCHQPDGGSCRFKKVMGEEKRCVGAKTLDIRCGHKGKPSPLREKVVQEEKRQRDQTLIQEAPPKIVL